MSNVGFLLSLQQNSILFFTLATINLYKIKKAVIHTYEYLPSHTIFLHILVQ